MTPEHFDALFDTFHTTAARFEALPAYQVADYEGARLEAFLAGQPLPPRTIVTDPWLARIATTTLAGKKWLRVRVVDHPLTDYQRFELAVYPESQAVGEDIRVVHTGPDVSWAEGPDFWLFDADTPAARAVLMSYEVGTGQWVGARLVDDPDTIGWCQGRLEQALARSMPLNEFLAVPHG